MDLAIFGWAESNHVFCITIIIKLEPNLCTGCNNIIYTQESIALRDSTSSCGVCSEFWRDRMLLR